MMTKGVTKMCADERLSYYGATYDEIVGVLRNASTDSMRNYINTACLDSAPNWVAYLDDVFSIAFPDNEISIFRKVTNGYYVYNGIPLFLTDASPVRFKVDVVNPTNALTTDYSFYWKG